MRKIAGVLLMAVMAWGCSDDDDEKRVGDYELPSDFFYQTVWRGNVMTMTYLGTWSVDTMGLEFVSDTTCLVRTKDRLSAETFSYSMEEKVLHFSHEKYKYYPYGYWFLTYCTGAMDSLVFKKEAYDEEPIIMTLKRVSLEEWK